VTGIRGSATLTPQVLEDEITLLLAGIKLCAGFSTKKTVGLPLEALRL
jgi:hypothetical protein